MTRACILTSTVTFGVLEPAVGGMLHSMQDEEGIFGTQYIGSDLFASNSAQTATIQQRATCDRTNAAVRRQDA